MCLSTPIDDLPWLHERDLGFMLDVRTVPREELDVMLVWQCVEWWRRVAVLREIARRDGLAVNMLMDAR